jgi:hypothetical protein
LRRLHPAAPETQTVRLSKARVAFEHELLRHDLLRQRCVAIRLLDYAVPRT